MSLVTCHSSLVTQLAQHVRTAHADADLGFQFTVMDTTGAFENVNLGLADVAGNVPVTDSTVFMSYSMSKVITAISALQLAQEGLLDLDADAHQYIPWLPYAQPISTRQLLAHTAGIPNAIPLRWVHLPDAHGTFKEDSALRAVLADNADLTSTPGTRYRYSNIDYWIVGAIIEHITGRSYEAVVRDKIFRPLGLTHTGFLIPSTLPLAKGYLRRWTWMNLFKWLVTDSEYWGEYEDGKLNIVPHYVNGPAYGGLYSTSHDLARICADLLRTNSILLNAASRATLFTAATLADGSTAEMTPGLHIVPHPSLRIFMKEGGGAGFHNELRLYPDLGIVAVLQTNDATFDVKKVYEELEERSMIEDRE
ncbi:MAG: beta-lactamase family protein [Bacteroidetes bacterium]|nr:beta-lactamase family protein [Bacteroidota bacterium]